MQYVGMGEPLSPCADLPAAQLLLPALGLALARGWPCPESRSPFFPAEVVSAAELVICFDC